MATIKQILNAFGKASARNAHPSLSEITIYPERNNWNYRWIPPNDGVVWFRIYSCKDISTSGESFTGVNFRYDVNPSTYFGGFFFVVKGHSITIFFDQGYNTASSSFWFYANKYES